MLYLVGAHRQCSQQERHQSKINGQKSIPMFPSSKMLLQWWSLKSPSCVCVCHEKHREAEETRIKVKSIGRVAIPWLSRGEGGRSGEERCGCTEGADGTTSGTLCLTFQRQDRILIWLGVYVCVNACTRWQCYTRPWETTCCMSSVNVILKSTSLKNYAFSVSRK